MGTASDLEVFSATTFLLVPLHISVFLGHLSGRAVGLGSKPPALFSGVELTYYRHQVACSVLIVESTTTLISTCIIQGHIADTNVDLERNLFQDSLLESTSRATKDAGSGQASRNSYYTAAHPLAVHQWP